MEAALQAEYRAARDAERTGDSFRVWRAGALTQAAVAWLLGCVFVRFVEDNGLVDAALIAGPGERNARSADRQTLYFRARPTDSDRDYLLDVFAEVARLPGMAAALRSRAQPGMAPRYLRRRRPRSGGVLASGGSGFGRAPPRLHRFGLGHPLPRRPVPGPLRRGEEALCPVANTGARRGVHPGPHPHSRPGRIRPPRHPPHRSRLRLRSLPAGRVCAVAARMVQPGTR